MWTNGYKAPIRVEKIHLIKNDMKKLLRKIALLILKYNDEYSFNDFYEDMMKVASQNGQNYCRISIERYTDEEVIFQGYFHNSEIRSGSTPKEVIDQFKPKKKSEIKCYNVHF